MNNNTASAAIEILNPARATMTTKEVARTAGVTVATVNAIARDLDIMRGYESHRRSWVVLHADGKMLIEHLATVAA